VFEIFMRQGICLFGWELLLLYWHWTDRPALWGYFDCWKIPSYINNYIKQTTVENVCHTYAIYSDRLK